MLKMRSTVYTISPVSVTGAKQLDSLDGLKKVKLDLVITLGGDGTTLRTFRNLENEKKQIQDNENADYRPGTLNRRHISASREKLCKIKKL